MPGQTYISPGPKTRLAARRALRSARCHSRTPSEARAIRKWLGLPKRVEYSEAELDRRRQAMTRAREAIQPLAA